MNRLSEPEKMFLRQYKIATDRLQNIRWALLLSCCLKEQLLSCNWEISLRLSGTSDVDIFVAAHSLFPTKQLNEEMNYIRHLVGLALAATAFLFTGRQKIEIKSADQAYIEMQKQAQMENVKQNNTISTTLTQMNGTLSAIQQQLQRLPQASTSSGTVSQVPSEKEIEERVQRMMGNKGSSGSQKPAEHNQQEMMMGPQAPHLNTKDFSTGGDTKKQSSSLNKAMPTVAKSQNKTVFIPAGTRIPGIMETGALAPVIGVNTTFRSPSVLIRLTQDGITANFGTAPLKDAVVLAKANGIWNLERVRMETQTFDLVLPGWLKKAS